jgi:hypothetical protein
VIHVMDKRATDKCRSNRTKGTRTVALN